MDLVSMLAELRAERDQIAEAMLVLERIASSQGRRRGRPPKWMTVSDKVTEQPRRRRKPFSAATRAKMAAAQRKRWAAKKTAT